MATKKNGTADEPFAKECQKPADIAERTDGFNTEWQDLQYNTEKGVDENE